MRMLIGKPVALQLPVSVVCTLPKILDSHREDHVLERREGDDDDDGRTESQEG
jgi:hypothetical protein